MTRPDPTHPTSATPDAGADAALKAALRARPVEDAAAVDALSARVMAQWQQAHGQGAEVLRAGPTLAARWWQRRLWLGSAGLVAAAVVATAMVMTRPDPSIEELMQPDVLSQMAIGEM